MRYDATNLKAMSNTVRCDALRAVLSAHSGHIGIVLGAADIVTAVFANFMRRGVDRFVLSAGHGSAMLYAVLRLAGYHIGSIESFRKIGGLPGHPEYGIDGVDATTGPLGQGVGNAVGMALAEKINGGNGRVYCMCGDGDLSEGVANESIAFAGRYKLNNLVLLWDDNGITIDGDALTDMDIPTRMRAAGWNVITVDGRDGEKISRAIADTNRLQTPTFIQCKTIIGQYSSVAGTSAAHGFALDDMEIEKLIKQLDSPMGRELWKSVATATSVMPKSPRKTIDLSRVKMPSVAMDVSTREMSGAYIDAMLNSGAKIIGGSADLGLSTNTFVKNSIPITAKDFNGNFIEYGVREHAMASIMNGMAACGLRPYGSTFLAFSDYMRPAMRLAAMSGLPVVYVLTHDSIAVGEDGPTHQPVEQLASLRLIPNMNVFRPCNMTEVAISWRIALAEKSRPSCIVLSRQKIHQIESPAGADIVRGAYGIYPAKSSHIKITIIATGAEVPLAVAVAQKIGNDVQVVSCPSVERFRSQSALYKQQILRGFVVAIEAASPSPWFEFADAVVGVNQFGISGRGADVYAAMGFDANQIAHEIMNKVK